MKEIRRQNSIGSRILREQAVIPRASVTPRISSSDKTDKTVFSNEYENPRVHRGNNAFGENYARGIELSKEKTSGPSLVMIFKSTLRSVCALIGLSQSRLPSSTVPVRRTFSKNLLIKLSKVNLESKYLAEKASPKKDRSYVINLMPYLKWGAQSSLNLSRGGAAIFKAVFSVLASSLMIFLKSFLSLMLAMLVPLAYAVRLVYVLLLRWMKINGVHGTPSVRVRQSRMLVLGGSFVLFSMVIIARLFSLQSSEHGKWEQIASKQHITQTEIAGSRGAILDRNGLELAVSIPAIAVGVHPAWLKDKNNAVSRLAKILSMPEKDILTKLDTDKPYVLLARGVSQALEQDLRALKIYGIEIDKDFNRVYPQGALASTIIGRTGREGSGLSGIERSYHGALDAPPVARSIRRDARGRLMSSSVWEDASQSGQNVLFGNPSLFKKIPEETISRQAGVQLVKSLFSPSGRNDARATDIRGSADSVMAHELRKEGANIVLTIDANIQNVLEEELDAAKERAKAKHVFGLMMDANSGEIVAMGQTSRFDPNKAGGVDPEALRNVVLQNSFEPGSTFKPIVSAIVLDQGLARYEEIINCENGKMRVGKHTIRDAHPVPPVSFEQVLVRSSNIGMAKLGFRLGKEGLYESLRAFGFGEKSYVGIDGESKGIMRKGSSWAQIDIATHSFGQGVSVTALQLVRAYGALANGGILVHPKIIKSIEADPSNVNSNNEIAPVRVLKADTVAKIRRALNLVTEDAHGTGKNSRIPGVPVYGKTGTAQKARETGKGYDPSKVLASFIGFVDGDPVGVKKTLVLYIAVDEPGVSPRWGGTLAAPVFKQVMERTLSYLISQDPSSRPQIARTVEQGGSNVL